MPDSSVTLSTLIEALPASSKILNHSQDAIAALVHSLMTQSGFTLIATEDSGPASEDPANTLPESWNGQGPSHYTFRYRHAESKDEVHLNLSRLANHIIVNAVALESDRTAYMDIPINNLMSSTASFPLCVDADNNTSLLRSAFVNLDAFISQFELAVIEKLLPPKQSGSKLLDTAELASSSQPPRPTREAGEVPRPDPSPPPARPQVPGEGLISGITNPLPPRNPLEIGRNDLDPLGGYNPFQPPRLFPGAGGDGMFVGPDHPIFGGGARGGIPGGPPSRGPWGGDGYLPPMGAPPGARFDPVMPGNPMGGGRNPGLGPFGGRGPGSRRSGEPDNDEFMPPGANDMFS